jgi:hypothetical protein
MMVPVQMSRPAGPRFELCFRSFPASAPRIGGQNRCPAAAALNRCGCRRRAGSGCPGRFVRRGEKGIFILAPMVGNKRKKDETEQATDAKETQRTLYGFRGVYVFDRLSRDLRPSLCALDGFRRSHFRKSPRLQAHHRSNSLSSAMHSQCRVPAVGTFCPPIRGSERERLIATVIEPSLGCWDLLERQRPSYEVGLDFRSSPFGGVVEKFNVVVIGRFWKDVAADGR